jgi:osmoprotectant transport system ATP-binding protein
VRDIALSDSPTLGDDAEPDEARRLIERVRGDCVLVLDRDSRPSSWLGADHLHRLGQRPLAEIGLPVTTVEPHATLADTLNAMITARYSTAVVVDDSGKYLGSVDIDTINEAIRGMRSDLRERLRAGFNPAANTAPEPDS